MGKKKKFPRWLDSMEENMDERVVTYLHRNNDEYRGLSEKLKQLSEKYPVLTVLADQNEGCTLTAEEHQAWKEYHSIWCMMELLERKVYYCMGHMEKDYYRRFSEEMLQQDKNYIIGIEVYLKGIRDGYRMLDIEGVL